MTKNLNSQPDSIRTVLTPLDSSWPELAGEDDRHRLLSFLEERFGIPKTLFKEYLMFKKKRNWWLLKDSPMITMASQMKIWRVGLKAFHEIGEFVKPTTRMIQIFGHSATRGVFNIYAEDLQRLIAGEFIAVDMDIDNGYVILTLDGIILGLGLLIDGKIRSQIPKKDLRFLLYKT